MSLSTLNEWTVLAILAIAVVIGLPAIASALRLLNRGVHGINAENDLR